MKATEVLRRYAKGERNFQRVNLRGQSFKGKDLSGANFREADIRGTNFKNANLQGVNFTEAKAGLQKRWSIILLLVLFCISFLSSIVNFSAVLWIVTILANYKQFHRILDHLAIFLMCGILIVFYYFSLKENLSKSLLKIGAIIIFLLFFCLFAQELSLALYIAIILSLAIVIIVSIVNSIIFITSFLITEIENIYINEIGTITLVIGYIAGIRIGIISNIGSGAINNAFQGRVENPIIIANYTWLRLLTLILPFIMISLSGYIAKRILKKELEEDFWFIKAAKVFATIKGTNFTEAILDEANFGHAILKGTNFNRASLMKTIWVGTKRLNHVRAGDTYLNNRKLLSWLTQKTGKDKNFDNQNLSGVNLRNTDLQDASFINADLSQTDLEGANLTRAKLRKTQINKTNLINAVLEYADCKYANLSNATLRRANLSHANLTAVNAIETDFNEAHLTGACIESWNINQHTNLTNIECQYVFLLEYFNEYGIKERRPSSGNFEPGEFTKLFEEVLSTVDLIFKNGVNWKAFIAAIEEVQVQNKDTPLKIQSIENKDYGVFVIKVKVPPEANKENIHQDFNEAYKLKLEAVECKYKALLEKELAKKDEETQKKIFNFMNQQSTNMMEITKALANRPIYAEATAMIDSSNNSKTLKAGQDINISDAVVNLADFISDVNLALSRDERKILSNDTNNNELKTLLKELTAVIESETDLDDEEKTNAANQVKKIALASQKTDDEGLQKKAKRAVDLLETIAKGLEPTSKLANACKEILPKIITFLGLSIF